MGGGDGCWMDAEQALALAADAWVRAAMLDYPQSHVGAKMVPEGACAASLIHENCGHWKTLTREAYLKLLFRCPDHTGFHPPPHFNDNPHNWDWLTLARKLGTEPYTLEVGNG